MILKHESYVFKYEDVREDETDGWVAAAAGVGKNAIERGFCGAPARLGSGE